MPLPSPKLNEDRSEFISRCVRDQVTKDEFPNMRQRVAVCVRQYDEK